jgi:hypothetical protein
MSAKAAIKIIPILVVLGLSTFGIVLISGLLNTTSLVQSHGTITTPPSTLTLGIYSNSACTTPITDISWGGLQPGGSTSQTVYVKNTGNVAATLSCTFGNWVPSGAASYIIVSWNKEGARINPNESVAAMFTLTVSPSITGITTYSVVINIIATQS